MNEKKTNIKRTLYRGISTLKSDSKNRGITLVALVITVILLLILAGVAISTISGEDGLMAKTKKSKFEQLKAEAMENIKLAIMEIQLDEIPNGRQVTLQTLHDKLPIKDERIQTRAYYIGDKQLKGIYTANKETKFNFVIDDKLNVKLELFENGEFPITVTEIKSTSVKVTGKIENLKSSIVNYTYIAEKSSGEKVVFENIAVETFTITALEQATEYEIYMLAYDSHGKEIKSDIQILVTGVDQTLIEQNLEIIPDKTELTNSNIQVEVKWGYNGTNAKREISIDGGEIFKQYTGAVEVEKNTAIVAKITIGEIVISKEKKIQNIDKLVPNSFTPTVSDTVSSTELTISANTTDHEATEEFASSGIKGYKYFVYEGSSLIDNSDIINETTWKATGLTVGNTYNIYVEAYDNAGNQTKSQKVDYIKLDVYAWEKFSLNSSTKYELNISEDETRRVCFHRRDYYPIYPVDSFSSSTGKFSYSGNTSLGSSMASKWTNVPGRYYGYTSSYTDYSKTISTVYCPGIRDSSWSKYGSYEVYYHTGLKTATGVKTTTYSKGSVSYGIVYSNEKDFYPSDGYQDEYWYVKKE